MSMGAKRVRGFANDPLVPLAGMLLAAMFLLGSASGEAAADRSREEATERPAAVTSTVGKVYTPRLVLSGSVEAGGGHEAATPGCVAVNDTRVSYRMAMAGLRMQATGT